MDGSITTQAALLPPLLEAGPRRLARLWPAARLRLHLLYLIRHQRRVNLVDPATLTALIQWRKLHDRDARLPQLIDKLTAKYHAAEVLGQDWITPTLWSGTRLPEQPLWPTPFVVKSRHGCNQRHFIRTGQEDWHAIRADADRWMRRDYGKWLDEWGYRHVPRGLIVEPFVGQNNVLPIDYKLFVFGGKVTHIQVHLDRETAHHWMVFDRNWTRLSRPVPEGDPPPPASLSEMMRGAEALARNFDFVRADFYEISGKPRFGELTFYPGSGLCKVDPPWLDAEWGRLWLEAIAAKPVNHAP